MKHNRWMMASLFGGVMLLAAGCVEEKNVETGGIPGTRIVFSAMTSYENSDATRTEYSGELFGTTPKVERIDWVANTDKFTVNYAAGTSFTTADYLVTSVRGDNYNSLAGVTEANKGQILAWATGSDHKFYAMYPPHSVNTTASLTNVNHFQATLPAAQPQTHTQNVTVEGNTWSRRLPDMNNAFMVAYAGTDNGMVTGDGVKLPFRPAVTTFEFRLRRTAGEEGKNIRYFKLISEGHALTGQFSFDITGGDARGGSWNESDVTVEAKSATNSVITVDFGETGVAVPAHTSTDYLDFTVFAVPKTLNDLKIQLIDVDGKIRELPLMDKVGGVFTNYHSFTGAKKYVITNTTVPGEWEYVIETSDDIVTYGHLEVPGLAYTVKSYKHSGTTYLPVSWKIQYSTDDGANWVDFDASTLKTDVYHGNDPDPTVDWNLSFEANALTGVGTGNATDVNSAVLNLLGESAGKIAGDEVAAAQRAKLAAHNPRGTMENPFDLSKHPVYGVIDDEVAQTTANSYVISAPGVYMFPCVYGNGISMGRDNVSAYWPGKADDAYSGVTGDNRSSNLKEVNDDHNTDASYWRAYTPRFYNAIDAEIQKPYIFEDLSITSPSAVVVWQDTDADNGEFKHQLIPFSNDYVDLVDKNIDGKRVKYIRFKIDADRIRTGNFVIALRGRAGSMTSPEILWSWHIWITPDDLTPNDVVTNTTGTYYLMPKNMGWFDSDHGSVSQWPIRGMKFRAVQTEAYAMDASNNPLYKDDSFKVTQIGDADETSPTVGGNVYYQWGRKDPFLPVGPDGKNHPVVYNSLFTDRIVMTSDGIKDKVLDDTRMDYGASIREPYSPFRNEVDGGRKQICGYIGGPVYPYEQPGSPIYNYTIDTGHEKWGPFTVAQATVLQNTDFCDYEDWIGYAPVVNDAHGTFYRSNRDYTPGPFTEADRDAMIAAAPLVFALTDFTGSGDSWTLTSYKNGPYTFEQAILLNGTSYADSDHWVVVEYGPATTHAKFELPRDYPYHYGPYSQAEADNFVRGIACPAIFTAGLPGSGCDMIAHQIGGGGIPYPASMRSQAANVTNLWNAYQYDEETSGSSYTNKFKTIYDPCPPGFTVPVKQVFVGSRTFSDQDRFTAANGMHMKISQRSDVFGGSAQLVDGYGGNDEQKGLQIGTIFLPFTGARVFRDAGEGHCLHAEGMGTAGYYWTDSPLRINWRHPTDPSVPTYNASFAGPNFHITTVMSNQYWFYFDAFGLIFGSDSDYDNYIVDSYRVQSYTRATAFSMRPMKDPKVNYSF